MALVFIAIGLLALYLILKGSEWITDASVDVARRLSTTNIAVGLLLVATLLSLPELVVALSSVAKGHTGMGIGVTLGSVIVNIGLIVGISALIRPLRVSRAMIVRDAVFMVVITIVVAAVALEDLELTRVDGFIFLLLFIPYLVNVYEQERVLTTKQRTVETQKIVKSLRLFGKTGFGELVVHDGLKVFLAGVALLLIGGELFTHSMIGIAGFFGLSDFVIGITLGALGPSLPNLASAVQAAKRGYEELAVSETIGSNIFTMLITLGVIALATPQPINFVTAVVTTPAMLLLSFLLLFFMMRGRIGRRAGAALLAIYLLATILQLVVPNIF
ncbi:MAG: sodium:calcium antiporter [Candidatus Micrarchaeia archaeon]